jgi:hypothetical protein
MAERPSRLFRRVCLLPVTDPMTPTGISPSITDVSLWRTECALLGSLFRCFRHRNPSTTTAATTAAPPTLDPIARLSVWVEIPVELEVRSTASPAPGDRVDDAVDSTT